MFVRRKINQSGSISITVVDKSRGRYEVVKSFGTVRSAAEADLLENKAREFVREQTGEPETLFGEMSEAQLREYAATLPQGRIELAGPELLFGGLYDRLGIQPCGDMPAADRALFRHLVLCRIYDPGSKFRTAGYVQRYLGTRIDAAEIYRLTDSLHLPDFVVSPKAPAVCRVLTLRNAKVSFWLLSAADGSPVAARLVDRKRVSVKALDKPVQRLARKLGAERPVPVVKGGEAEKPLLHDYRISKKDLDTKPFSRRLRGRVEGHLCVCLAACAVQAELERLLDAAGCAVTLPQVREAAASLFRLNYLSTYTGRPKSVLLKMTPLQKQLFDLLH